MKSDEELDPLGAARLISARPETIYRWLKSRRLPAHKRGGRWVIRRADLLKMTILRRAISVETPVHAMPIAVREEKRA